MGGQELQITQSEHKVIIKAKGLVHLPRINTTINTASIVSIIDEEQNRQGLTKGFHGGIEVFKKFGTWRESANPEVILDSYYYKDLYENGPISLAEYNQKQYEQRGIEAGTQKSVRELQ